MIRVVIVDDQKVVTQGLKVLLESEPDIQIVGLGSNGQEAIALATDLQPDVLLIDQYMPVMDGIAATQAISQKCPNIAILLLSGSDENDRIAEALQGGAKGYLLKTTSAEDLANSIRSVHRGYSQMGPGLLEKLLAKVNTSTQSPGPTPLTVLSPQTPLETELLQILNYSSQFDLDAMTHWLEAVDSPRNAALLMGLLEKWLQQHPTHLVGLYLSGQLINKFQQHNRLALNYFRLAFQQAQIQKHPLSTLMEIGRAAWMTNSQESLSWLMTVFRNWPSQQSYRPLFDALRQTFGSRSEPYCCIKAFWEIQHLKGLCEQTNALQSKLSILLDTGVPGQPWSERL